MARKSDIIFPLNLLAAYPASDSLDATFCLPDTMDTMFNVISPTHRRRRVWLLAPESAPVIRIGDVQLAPVSISEGSPRWVDYGVAELPLGFSQLRLRGMAQEECADAHLLVTGQVEQSFAGCTLAEAERILWGISREETGNTSIEPAQVCVGEQATLRCRYTAGAHGLPAGAQIRFTIPRILGEPQNQAADDPGYLRITNADSPVAIARIALSDESHEFYDIFCRLEDGLAPGGGCTVQFSTVGSYLIAHRRAEADRPYWYAVQPPLATAVLLSNEHQPVSLADAHSHAFTILPGPSERLHLFLPGRRRADEALFLQGIFTDRYRNFPPGTKPDVDLDLWLVSGDDWQPLGPAAGCLRDDYRFTAPLPQLAPGIYRAVAARAGTREVIACSNPLQIIGDGDCLYWGEIHGHTEMSDGIGGYPGLYRHAREVGCLDFAAAADHACYFSDNQWRWMQDVTNAANANGRFATLIGYEWAGQQVHRNIYTSRTHLDLFRGMYPPTSTLDVVWNHFHGDEEIAGGPHAPLAHGIVWEHHDPTVERFVEIYSMWGANDDRENPLMTEAARHGDGMSTNELLLAGAKLGFTGGGDCHDGRVGFTAEAPAYQGRVPQHIYAPLYYHCGLTAAVMPELNRSSLIGALRNRATCATTGPRILLDFSIGNLPMGAAGTVQAVTCHAGAHGVEPLTHVEIIKDGQTAWSQEVQALDVTLAWDDPQPTPGEHWYYLRVTQVDGEMAWSSPIWVTSGSV